MDSGAGSAATAATTAPPRRHAAAGGRAVAAARVWRKALGAPLDIFYLIGCVLIATHEAKYRDATDYGITRNEST